MSRAEKVWKSDVSVNVRPKHLSRSCLIGNLLLCESSVQTVWFQQCECNNFQSSDTSQWMAVCVTQTKYSSARYGHTIVTKVSNQVTNQKSKSFEANRLKRVKTPPIRTSGLSKLRCYCRTFSSHPTHDEKCIFRCNTRYITWNVPELITTFTWCPLLITYNINTLTVKTVWPNRNSDRDLYQYLLFSCFLR